MKQRIVFSSEFYFIKALDLKKLPVGSLPCSMPKSQNGEDCLVIFLADDGSLSTINPEKLLSVAADAFIKTRIAYYTYPLFFNLLLNLIKPLKRRLYIKSTVALTTKLSKILDAHLPRGVRNAQNAYQFQQKRFQVSPETAKKRYSELYSSLKNNGYDAAYPMVILLNRKFGLKDQLLQGHHRIGICKELKIEDVSVSFYAAPALLHLFKPKQ